MPIAVVPIQSKNQNTINPFLLYNMKRGIETAFSPSPMHTRDLNGAKARNKYGMNKQINMTEGIM